MSWVVEGKTISGETVRYKVAAGKDTDKAFVMALAFQEHGSKKPDDALTSEVTTLWVSENISRVPNLTIMSRGNFDVQRMIAKGIWEKAIPRAFSKEEAALDALESKASEFPHDRFRIVRTTEIKDVVAESLTAQGIDHTEKPDKEDTPQNETLPEDPPEGNTEPASDDPQASESPKTSNGRRALKNKAA